MSFRIYMKSLLLSEVVSKRLMYDLRKLLKIQIVCWMFVLYKKIRDEIKGTVVNKKDSRRFLLEL